MSILLELCLLQVELTTLQRLETAFEGRCLLQPRHVHYDMPNAFTPAIPLPMAIIEERWDHVLIKCGNQATTILLLASHLLGDVANY